MISYAQNFEDVILARVFAGQAQGFYVDVGASDPVVRSVTKHFYDLGWRGINVEPTARYHRALVEARPRDVNLQVAVGREPGRLTLFEFDSEGITTLSEEFAAHFMREGHACRRHPIEVLPLREVCERHCAGPIDFMKVDVEGWEKEVLEGADWSRFRPRVLLVEATLPNSHDGRWGEWEPALLGHGYLFTYFDGLNRYYVAKQESDLLARFSLPPNVLDNFEVYETVRLRRELALCKAAMGMGSSLRLLLLETLAWLRRRFGGR